MPGLRPLLDALLLELSQAGIDPAAWLVGWGRLLPSAFLVPAFGLRALPLPARAIFALALAACVAPALEPIPTGDARLLLAFAEQLWIGLPVALTAATAIWAGSMAGSLIDDLIGIRSEPDFPAVGSTLGPFGVLLGLATSAAFIELGGPARLADALALATPLELGARQLVVAMIAGLQIAVAVVAPVLVAQVFFSVFQGLLARTTNSGAVISLSAPLRQVLLILAAAVLLDRIMAALATWLRASW